jgi:hypothetical protein
MPIYKEAADKATETATFRLTRREKQLLDFLASAEHLTITDLLRRMIAERAERQGTLPDFDAAPFRRRPGRPRKIAVQTPAVRHFEPVSSSVPAPMPTTPLPAGPATPSFSEPHPPMTFGMLTDSFRTHFASRAEGTRAEFEETLVFVKEHFSVDGLLKSDTPLQAIDGERLGRIRDRIRTADIRFPRKNLYLFARSSDAGSAAVHGQGGCGRLAGAGEDKLRSIRFEILVNPVPM